MRAAVMREVGAPLVIEDVEISSPRHDEVLVDVVSAGLCHSDLRFIEGAFPHELPTVLGHEVAGVVREVGESVQSLQAGDHVVMSLSVFCGTCDFCVAGKPHLCIDKSSTRRGRDEPPRLMLHGEPIAQFLDLSGFAERMLVHQNAAVPIRPEVPLEVAAMLGCGVATGLGAIFNTAHVRIGDTVAVIGCGGVGLAAVQAARIAGASQIIAIDPFPAKLELARRLGATDEIESDRPDLVARVVDLTGGLGVDHAVEAVGSRDMIQKGFAMTRRGGTTTVVGLVPAGSTVEIATDLLFYERKLQGSVMGSNDFKLDVPRYAQLYLDGALNLDDMVTERIPLEQVNAGFNLMRAGKSARVLIEFGS